MDAPATGPDDESPSPDAAAQARPTPAERTLAVLEILICSDYPTQIALGATFAAFGWQPQEGGTLSLSYIATVSLVDSVFLTGLIVFFLRMRGERPREVFFGTRSISAEARAGVPLMFVAFGIALVVLLTLQAIAPSLHTVPHNPLQDLVRTPGDAALFALVLIVAGGIREEIQRAFLLRRFERWLGGAKVGLILSSVMFGAGHFLQGADAAVATAALGAFWGYIYLRRRSIAAPVVSHAGFNLVQVMQYLALAR
jgi:membrane protease YdiL (CAAX protease family)